MGRRYIVDIITLSNEITKLASQVEEINASLLHYKYIAGAIAIALPLGGWAIYKKYLLNRISRHIQEFVKSQEPDLTQIFFDSYQDNMYRFTSLLALAGSNKYDEAIDLFAPINSPSDVAKYPVPIQKTIAHCLIETKKNREDNRAIAWRAHPAIESPAPSARRLSLGISR
jgi:hypothetical protein